VKIIEREELKTKLDRGDDFKLVMTLGELAFQAQHIPGSINLSKMGDIESRLQKDDEIVVYCSDQACIASQAAYIMMEKEGYTNVRRYAGGLSDWSSSRYELEGFSID